MPETVWNRTTSRTRSGMFLRVYLLSDGYVGVEMEGPVRSSGLGEGFLGELETLVTEGRTLLQEARARNPSHDLNEPPSGPGHHGSGRDPRREGI